eukprot:6187122-Pleurochrysis_carterae.AAC.1
MSRKHVSLLELWQACNFALRLGFQSSKVKHNPICREEPHGYGSHTAYKVGGRDGIYSCVDGSIVPALA